MSASVIWAFFRRDALEALSYRGAFLIRLAGLLMSLVSLLFLSRFIDTGDSPLLQRYGGAYLPFSLTGIVLLNLQHVFTSAYAERIRRAQMAGTLEAMLTTPTPGWVVLVCAPLYRIVTAYLGGVLVLVLGGAVLGVRFDPAGLPALTVALVLGPLTFTSLGFVAATLTMLLRRSDPLTVFLAGISALFSGVLYPVSVLPDWMRTAANVLPITHVLEIARRGAFAGADLRSLAGPIVTLSITCALLLPLGLVSFTWAVRRARRDGSLSHY